MLLWWWLLWWWLLWWWLWWRLLLGVRCTRLLTTWLSLRPAVHLDCVKGTSCLVVVR